MNYNFFGGIAEAFCARKELELAFVLDFFVSFFIKEKRKIKEMAIDFLFLIFLLLNICTGSIAYYTIALIKKKSKRKG